MENIQTLQIVLNVGLFVVVLIQTIQVCVLTRRQAGQNKRINGINKRLDIHGKRIFNGDINSRNNNRNVQNYKNKNTRKYNFKRG